jgi:hypothetical protein
MFDFDLYARGGRRRATPARSKVRWGALYEGGVIALT